MFDDSVSVSNTPVAESGPHVLTSSRKTLRVLEVMAQCAAPVGVSELAQLLGSSRGTVHKQLSTLVASGWVEQNALGHYHLSLLPVRIGQAALRQSGLGEKVQRVLEQVAAATGECATIAALDNDAGLIVQRAESDRVVSADIRVGSRLPLRDGASNLVLLAFATTADQRESLRASGVAVAAEEQIAAVHSAGFAHTVDAFVDHASAVSIPLYDEFGLRTTALTLVGPHHRVDRDTALVALRGARDAIRTLGSPRPGDA